ncbi:hypothetical protein BYT27DRAFT_7171315 [Phlegmacium glaucopus]|nr:hypothetical protein BYT27DRAFT_7171315 [Phlegmacium glaucopus]
MSLQILPVELVDHVAHYLPTTDLVALSTTNSYLYPVAQRWLYRQITINYSSNNLAVVFTLASKPRLACHVRTFAIRLGSFSVLLSSFYRLLQTALSNMSELVSLDIFLDHAASWIMRTRDDATYNRLEHFASSFHLDHHVTHFLQKTNALLELEVDSLPPTPIVPNLIPTALPMLSQFTGSSQVAQYVVPGRPVESIHLNSGDLTEDVAESLAKSTAHVLLLAAATTYHSVALIGTLTQCMDHLVHLRIVTTFNFSEPPDASYFVNISNALRSLPDLRTCEIWGIHWVSSKNDFHDEGTVWESEPFNGPDENHLDNLYSDFYFAT